MDDESNGSTLSSPSGGNNRWRRPYVYLTATAISLIVFFIYSMAGSAYFLYLWYANLGPGSSGMALSFGTPLILIVWLGIVSIPTVAGVTLLFQRSKWGIYISLGALALYTFTLPFGVYILDNQLDSPQIGLWPMFYASMIAVIAIYPVLVSGWRKVKWS